MPDPAILPAAPENSGDEDRKDEVLTRFKRDLNASKAHRGDWRDEARTLYDMAAGRQWEPEAEAQLAAEERPMVTFNVAGKYLDSMQGLQINNRQDIKYAAREAGDLKVNEGLTGAVAWGRDLSCMLDEETDAFYDCALTGEGWIEGYMDNDLGPQNVPGGSRVDPLEMYPDPTSRKRNYEDARFVIRIRFYSTEDYQELIGETDDTAADPVLNGLDADEDEGLKIIGQPQEYPDQGSAGTAPPTAKRRPVADYQWWERQGAMSVETSSYGTQVFSMDEWAQIEPMLKARQQKSIAEVNAGRAAPNSVFNFKATPIKRRVYFRALVAGSTVVKYGNSPYQKGFTYHALTGKRDRNKGIWYGIGRAILDPQRWVNKFFSTILYAMMTNAKGGIMAEENAFKDARKAQEEWANPNSIIWLREGAIAKEKIMPKPEARYPQGLDRLMEFSMNALPQTSGLNTELLGLADRVQAGVLEAQRKQSAMAIIAWAFDAMRRYYRSMGRMLAEYVKLYVPEGTLVMVAGEAGKQYVPLVKQQLNVDYDVIVDQAPTSVNQQERVWGVLQTIIPQLLQAGLSIPPAVLDYVPLPTDLVEQWKQTLNDPKKLAQQEASVKATMDKMIAETEKLRGDAKLDLAKVEEILAELRKPPEANTKIAEASIDAKQKSFAAQLKGEIDSRIAELKTNREAETKLLIADMNIKSEERIAKMNAAIDARLAQAKTEADTASKVTVAAIARGAKEPTGPAPEEVLLGAIKDLRGSIDTMNKPRRHKIKRDKKGDLAEVMSEVMS